MKRRGGGFNQEFEKVCEKALKNNTEIETFYSKSKMKLPKIL